MESEFKVLSLKDVPVNIRAAFAATEVSGCSNE